MRVAVLLLAACVLAGPALADEPEAVTSDTQEYCVGLSRRMDPAEMPADARSLRAQGQVMCEHGQVRGGLARLRRAMVIIHGGSP